MGAGSFSLPNEIVVIAPNNDEVKKIAASFSKQLGAVGINVRIQQGNEPAVNSVFFSLSPDSNIPKEGYNLKVTNSGITVTAREPAGIFYAVQTLLQLFPKQIESKEAQKPGTPLSVPVVTIEDYPRFGWRGLMFDVSRHFFTKEQVKQYMDAMVKYKYNVLHLAFYR